MPRQSTEISTTKPLQTRVLQSSSQGIEPSPFKVFQHYWEQRLMIDTKYDEAIKKAEKKKADALIATGYYNIQDEIAAQGGYDIRAEYKEQVKEFDDKEIELEDQIADLQHYIDAMLGTKRKPGPLKQAEAFIKSREKTNKEATYALQDIFDDKNILQDKNREALEAAGLVGTDDEKDNFLDLLQAQKDNDPATILYLRQKEEFDRVQAHLQELRTLRDENAALREALKNDAREKLGTLRESIVEEHQKALIEASEELDNLLQARTDEVDELWDNGLPVVWKEIKDAVKLDAYRSLGDAQYFAATIKGVCSDLFKGLKNAYSIMRASVAEGHEERQKTEFSGEKRRDAFLNARATEKLDQENHTATLAEEPKTPPKEPESPEPTV
jgi:hypothetical protein